MSRGDIEGFAIGLAIIVCIVVPCRIMFDIWHDKEVDSSQPPASPSQVERVYTPSEAMVEVSNYTPNGHKSYGKGVVVKNNGKTFILTSSMIFTHEGQIMVNRDRRDRIACAATIIHQNDVWGLVALDCYLEGSPFVELNYDPNIPPDVQVFVGNLYTADTLEYINDDWVLLNNNLPPKATGMPVACYYNGLVGVIVGLNSANQEQAIMVGNRALTEFCDQVVRMDAPLPLETE